MAWRPANWVQEGELDNTTRGWTNGWICLQGREHPLQLKLAGNCHPDLAGWRFRIVRTDPIPAWAEPPNYAGIATDQSGIMGDVTADQLLKHYECSPDEFVQRVGDSEPPPTTIRRSLYLEWYSNQNGRVVIQDTRLAVERIGARGFELSEAEWAEQSKQNAEELTYFLHQIGDALDSESGAEPNDRAED